MGMRFFAELPYGVAIGVFCIFCVAAEHLRALEKVWGSTSEHPVARIRRLVPPGAGREPVTLSARAQGETDR